jgi:hypothetical protein
MQAENRWKFTSEKSKLNILMGLELCHVPIFQIWFLVMWYSLPALKMETGSTSKTSVNSYHSTRGNIAEDCHLHGNQTSEFHKRREMGVLRTSWATLNISTRTVVFGSRGVKVAFSGFDLTRPERCSRLPLIKQALRPTGAHGHSWLGASWWQSHSHQEQPLSTFSGDADLLQTALDLP